jgi:hypothetical protein
MSADDEPLFTLAEGAVTTDPANDGGDRGRFPYRAIPSVRTRPDRWRRGDGHGRTSALPESARRDIASIRQRRACEFAQEHASGRRPVGRLIRDDCARDHVAALGAERSRRRDSSRRPPDVRQRAVSLSWAAGYLTVPCDFAALGGQRVRSSQFVPSVWIKSSPLSSSGLSVARASTACR